MMTHKKTISWNLKDKGLQSSKSDSCFILFADGFYKSSFFVHFVKKY